MKFFILLIVVTVLWEASTAEEIPAYGYFKKIGIPLAEKMKAAEKEMDIGPMLRIVGGEQASPSQFPWQAILIVEIKNLSTIGVCGGSLLNSKTVLTAAHCWFDGTNQGWRVMVGLGSDKLYPGGLRVQTTDVVMHENYELTSEHILNDLAMVYMTSGVKFSDRIQPIKLPSGSQLQETFDGETATASGYGFTGGAALTINQTLNYVKLKVITNEQCALTYPSMIQDSNICTSGGGGNRSTCHGDSGGPLVIYRDKQPILIGVTSFGSNHGCFDGAPTTYSRVTSFIQWIESHLK